MKNQEEIIMSKGLTEVVFILDRSGSMRGLEADTIGGFNSMIEKQRKEEGEALISTVLFDDVSEVLYDRIPVRRIEPMTDWQYYVRGCTALLDAVGGAIRHIANVHKYAREEDRPEKTLFIITTDGMENASRAYTYDKVKKLVEKQKEKYGWEFLFLGANIDAAAEAGRFGIQAERAINYECDSQGTAVNFQAVSHAVSSLRRSRCKEEADAGILEAAACIQADYEERHEKNPMAKTGANTAANRGEKPGLNMDAKPDAKKPGEYRSETQRKTDDKTEKKNPQGKACGSVKSFLSIF